MIVLVTAASLRVGDLIMPEEFDPSLQPEDYDPECAVPVLEVWQDRDYLHVRVQGEVWVGLPMQRVLVVR